MSITKATIMNGAESFFLKGNKIGIVLSHGFVGTPQSVREVGELLNQYGYTVLAPRLTGHGTSVSDFETAKHTEWLNDLENAYLTLKETCEEVFIIGQSMGGALSLQLAAIHPEIKGVVTINAALHVPAYDKYANASVPRFIPEDAPDIKDPSAEEITYESVPLNAVHELQKVLSKTIDGLRNVHNPVLALVSEDDHVVPPSDSKQIVAEVSSLTKARVLLKNSYHVASLDYDKKLIAYYSHVFITKMINK